MVSTNIIILDKLQLNLTRMVCLVEMEYLWLQKLHATMPRRHTSLMTTGDNLTGVVVSIFWTLGHCDMIAVVCLVTRYLVHRHSTAYCEARHQEAGDHGKVRECGQLLDIGGLEYEEWVVKICDQQEL